jgi:hypothetical protein
MTDLRYSIIGKTRWGKTVLAEEIMSAITEPPGIHTVIYKAEMGNELLITLHPPKFSYRTDIRLHVSRAIYDSLSIGDKVTIDLVKRYRD